MKLTSTILLLFLICSFCSPGQNIILPEGEFMDTTVTDNPDCKGSNNVYYYQVGGKYPESSASLLNEAKEFMKKRNKKYSGNGYVTFRFSIDCEGKMRRRVQVLQTDDHYKSYHFSKNFVDELYSFVKTLNKWKIAKTKNGMPYFYTTLVTFKIKDGEIINIIP
jgi:hypothetical protein